MDGKPNDNIFEYFYEQPCHINESEIKNCYSVINAHGKQSLIPRIDKLGYIQDEKRIMAMNKAVNRFMLLNEKTKTNITFSINDLLEKKKTLAVHIRTGMNINNCPYHPVGVDICEHIDAAKTAVKKFGFEKIFIAADDNDAVTAFKKTFGKMAVYYDDVIRVSGEKKDLFFLTNDLDGTRKDHKFKMGFEVLRDVYTMAACEGIVAGLSNPPICAAYINGGKYEHTNFIYKGIYGHDIPIPKDKRIKKLHKHLTNKYKYKILK